MEFTGIFVVLVGLVGGVAVAVQAALAGELTARAGIFTNAFVVFTGGCLTAAVLFILFERGKIRELGTQPWYVYLAGPLGIMIITSIGYAIPRIGVGSTLALIVTSQLIIGAVMDHYGLLTALRPLQLNRLLGFLLLLAGTWIVLRQ